MKISITRSYSKKVQLRQFEPVDSFCAATVEREMPDPLTKEDSAEHTAWMEKTSAALDQLCRKEVDKTLAILRPAMKAVTGKGSGEQKETAKESADLDAANQELNLN